MQPASQPAGRQRFSAVKTLLTTRRAWHEQKLFFPLLQGSGLPQLPSPSYVLLLLLHTKPVILKHVLGSSSIGRAARVRARNRPGFFTNRVFRIPSDTDSLFSPLLLKSRRRPTDRPTDRPADRSLFLFTLQPVWRERGEQTQPS